MLSAAAFFIRRLCSSVGSLRRSAIFRYESWRCSAYFWNAAPESVNSLGASIVEAAFSASLAILSATS